MHVNGLALNIDNIEVMNYRRGTLTTYYINGNTLNAYKLDNDDESIFIHGRLYECKSEYLPLNDGNFAFLNLGETISFGRDILGTKPLYYSYNGVLRLASDARVLDEPKVVSGGMIYQYKDGLSMKYLKPLEIKENDDDIDDAKEKILSLLKDSVRRRMNGRCLLGLSGLDSMILAKISDCKQAIVCMEGSYDQRYAQRLSDRFDLDIILIDEDEISNTLKIITKILPFKDAMNMSIAITFYTLARYARENGYDSIMLGQLADELFAGYARYLSYDRKLLNHALYNDVMNAWKVNFIRDEIVTSPFTDLILPYTSLDLVRYVLGLKADLKIRNGIRKFVLREVAKMLGVDDDLANREKKAVQFSSGIFKVVKRLI